MAKPKEQRTEGKFFVLCFFCWPFLLIFAKQTQIIGHFLSSLSLFSLGFKSEIMPIIPFRFFTVLNVHRATVCLNAQFMLVLRV